MANSNSEPWANVNEAAAAALCIGCFFGAVGVGLISGQLAGDEDVPAKLEMSADLPAEPVPPPIPVASR